MEIDQDKIEFFQKSLLEWYKTNARKFRWRNKSATNYERIISEVLLQRTKADTVAKFYPRFIKKYPSWKQLGNATEEDLIEILKPIGLSKQRGKRLFKLAQELKRRNGIFPKERAMVEEIPMMGQYITNAFELFVLKKPAPLLDINMARVLERVFGKRKLSDIRFDPYLQNLGKLVVADSDSKELNWAILDLGAKTCTSKAPNCKWCPLVKICRNFNEMNTI